MAQAFALIVQQLGAPYGIFANAGIDIGGLIHEMPLELWKRILDTNLTGIFLTCKHGLQQMLAAQISGSVVCTSSPAGFIAMAAGGSGAYSATKGAISSLVRCMAIDYAKFGIRVNAIAPGATETSLMWSNVPAGDVDTMRAQLCREVPLGRLANAEEPARIVAWLLSDETAYMTGSHVVCDGGILAKARLAYDLNSSVGLLPGLALFRPIFTGRAICGECRFFGALQGGNDHLLGHRCDRAWPFSTFPGRAA